MRKIVNYVKRLWREERWLFSIFCFGMLSVLIEILTTIDLLYTTFFATGSSTFSREYIVSQSWAWSFLIIEFIFIIGIIALLLMFVYVIFMKIHHKPLNWKRTIILGTMSFWS